MPGVTGGLRTKHLTLLRYMEVTWSISFPYHTERSPILCIMWAGGAGSSVTGGRGRQVTHGSSDPADRAETGREEIIDGVGVDPARGCLFATT